MANYFSERNELDSKIRELIHSIDSLRRTKDDARQNYLAELAHLIKSRPGLTATQYAMLMSNDACERNSIQVSISGMGYMAEAHEKGWNARGICFNGNPQKVCNNPSMPSLKRKYTRVERRFIEVDENNQPIGTHETIEWRTTYSIKED